MLGEGDPRNERCHKTIRTERRRCSNVPAHCGSRSLYYLCCLPCSFATSWLGEGDLLAYFASQGFVIATPPLRRPRTPEHITGNSKQEPGAHQRGSTPQLRPTPKTRPHPMQRRRRPLRTRRRIHPRQTSAQKLDGSSGITEPLWWDRWLRLTATIRGVSERETGFEPATSSLGEDVIRRWSPTDVRIAGDNSPYHQRSPGSPGTRRGALPVR